MEEQRKAQLSSTCSTDQLQFCISRAQGCAGIHISHYSGLAFVGLAFPVSVELLRCDGN